MAGKKKELPLCKCGCGKQVERKSKKYFADHYKNPPQIEKVIPKKPIVPVAKKAKKKVKVAKKETKVTNPVNGKISLKNLQGCQGTRYLTI